MVNKFICWLVGHSDVLKEPVWTGNNALTLTLECSRCKRIHQIAFKRPHNWNEIPF